VGLGLNEWFLLSSLLASVYVCYNLFFGFGKFFFFNFRGLTLENHPAGCTYIEPHLKDHASLQERQSQALCRLCDIWFTSRERRRLN